MGSDSRTAKNCIGNWRGTIKGYKLAQLHGMTDWSPCSRWQWQHLKPGKKSLYPSNEEARRLHYWLCSAAGLPQSPISKGLVPMPLPSSYFLCALNPHLYIKSNFIPVLHLAHPSMQLQVPWGERSAGEAWHGGGGPLGVTNTNRNCMQEIGRAWATLGKKQSWKAAVSPQV